MATFKCKKCGNTLILPKGKDNVLCGFCGTAQTVTAQYTADEINIEAFRQQNHYQQLVHRAKTYRDITVLTETAEEFDRLGDYENSREMAEFCRQQAALEQEKQKQDVEKQVIEEQRMRNVKRRHRIKMTLINLLVVLLLIAITLFMNEYLSDKTWLLP